MFFIWTSTFTESSGNVDEWEGNDNGCIKIRQPPSRPKKAKVSYTFEVSESTCLFWQQNQSKWRTTGCKVKKVSFLKGTQALRPH